MKPSSGLYRHAAVIIATGIGLIIGLMVKVNLLLIIGATFGLIFYWLVSVWLKSEELIIPDAKILDAPERWKPAKPLYGGILFLIAAIIGLLVNPNIGLILAAAVAFTVGIVDDYKRLSPPIKFGGQFIAALFLVFAGFRIGSFPQPLDVVITMFFIVAVMNSFNMIDNMDGIASIVAIGVFAFALMSSDSRYINELLLPQLLMISVAVFLIYNWSPSTIFMGDSGTMLLGVFIAYFFMNDHHWVPLDIAPKHDQTVVALTMLTPIIVDTMVVIINRLIHGVSPFKGGRDHTTHNLVYLGLNESQVARIYGILTLVQLAMALSFHTNQKLFGEFGKPFAATLNFVYFILFFVTMLAISWRNLRKGKYSYSK